MVAMRMDQRCSNHEEFIPKTSIRGNGQEHNFQALTFIPVVQQQTAAWTGLRLCGAGSSSGLHSGLHRGDLDMWLFH